MHDSKICGMMRHGLPELHLSKSILLIWSYEVIDGLMQKNT